MASPSEDAEWTTANGWNEGLPLMLDNVLNVDALMSSSNASLGAGDVPSRAPSFQSTRKRAAQTRQEAPARQKSIKVTDDMTFEELEQQLLAAEQTAPVVEVHVRTTAKAQPSRLAHFSTLLESIWTRTCKSAIDESIAKGLDDYQAMMDRIKAVTANSISRMVRTVEFDSIRTRLRSLGINVGPQSAPPPLTRDQLALVKDEIDRDPGIASVTVYRAEWSDNGTTGLSLNSEAVKLFGYTPEELFEIWAFNLTGELSHVPLWVSLISDRDWPAVAEAGCRTLLGLKPLTGANLGRVHVVTKSGREVRRTWAASPPTARVC